MKKMSIAIDGPAGAGKSTVAQIVARRLKYIYIDTGAMYRAVSWKVLQEKLTEKDADAIIQIAKEITITLTYVDGKTTVFVDGCNVTGAIRNPEVSRMVSEVAQFEAVRKAMVDLQRKMAEQGGVVMDGRDIGTHVLPNADLKIFLTASIEERAQRRYKELTEKGFTIGLEELTQEIEERDKKDSEREFSPLIQAPDAIFMDTTLLSIEQAVVLILTMCKEREGIV